MYTGFLEAHKAAQSETESCHVRSTRLYYYAIVEAGQSLPLYAAIMLVKSGRWIVQYRQSSHDAGVQMLAVVALHLVLMVGRGQHCVTEQALFTCCKIRRKADRIVLLFKML